MKTKNVSNKIAAMDKEVSEAMIPIDWYTLSTNEAKSFGVSVGLYQDAIDYHERSKAETRATLIALVSVFAIAIVLIALGTSAFSIAAGIVAALVCQASMRWAFERLAWKFVKTHHNELISEVNSLAERHSHSNDLKTIMGHALSQRDLEQLVISDQLDIPVDVEGDK